MGGHSGESQRRRDCGSGVYAIHELLLAWMYGLFDGCKATAVDPQKIRFPIDPHNSLTIDNPILDYGSRGGFGAGVSCREAASRA
jgi:hypothetical protein